MSRIYPCVYCTDDLHCAKHTDDNYESWCVLGPCKDETPSNYDLLIRKTPEELAEWIMSIEPAACPFRDDYGDECRFTHCEKCWLDWLKQEAEE